MSDARKVIAREDRSLSKDGGRRYVIADSETGEVLDDAQGYGYRDPQKAHAAWGWKNRSPDKKRKNSKIKAWLKKHRKFVELMDDAAFYAAKDGDDFTAKDVKRLLENEGLEVDFTPAELLRAWRRN